MVLTDEIKIELLAIIIKGMFEGKKKKYFLKRTCYQVLKMGVDLSFFEVVLQPVAQETSDR